MRIRRALGYDLFADVTAVTWDYTFSTIGSENIQLVKHLPSLRRLAFVGTTRTNGRPPAPGHVPAKDANPELELEKQAVAFGAIAECRRLTSLTLFGGLTTDLHLYHLRRGGNLQKLELLHAPAVTDDGLRAIGRFESLTQLEIGDVPQVTEQGVAALADLTNLRSLALSDLPVSDSALASLSRLAKLERLSLDRCQITDEGIVAIAGWTRLTALRFSGSRISDAGLATIGGLYRLRELDLSDNELTDAGLENLLSLIELRTINLVQTRVTDEGLLTLQRMPGLQRVVVLLGDDLTLEGIRQVKKDLPDCLFECLSVDRKGRAPTLTAWE